LLKGSATQKGAGLFLSEIRQTDAIIHVLRCFDNSMVPHPEGSVDPLRDKETVDLELIAKDIGTLEKKIQRLDKMARVGEKDAVKSLSILKALLEHFENGEPARNFAVDEESKPYLDDCFFLTIKPVIYVCNVDEASAVSGNVHTDKVKPAIEKEGAEMILIAALAEAEIAQLTEEEDRVAFLKELWLNEPGVEKLIRSAYRALNLQTFFTEGPKEVRAWTIRQGTIAQKAAGVIHSDLERGFIRAEVKRWEDFVQLGSEHACKQAGKFHIEGKNYVVKDGDIFHVRFNV
ncbi:MAG TPA: redox-regulated ATPase YchF, partial [Bacteroidales bacterium]|nr:redox-regulated ATPase YchF [Bacteroidales bacterium]